MVNIAILKGFIYIFSAKNPDESELDEALNNVVSVFCLFNTKQGVPHIHPTFVRLRFVCVAT